MNHNDEKMVESMNFEEPMTFDIIEHDHDNTELCIPVVKTGTCGIFGYVHMEREVINLFEHTEYTVDAELKFLKSRMVMFPQQAFEKGDTSMRISFRH